MTPATRMRGQPVLVLGLLLGGWVALRAAFWEMPFSDPIAGLPGALLAGAGASEPAAQAVTIRPEFADLAASPASLPVPPVDSFAAPARLNLPDPLHPQLLPFAASAQVPQRLAVAHSMLMLSGLSAIPLPPELASLLAPQGAPYQPLTTFAASPAGGRWSADSWVLLRRDTTNALTSGRGSYGRSQTGAVLRYALAPSSAFRPLAYARVSQAIGASESELALGLSARPVPKLPVRAAAELRLTQSYGQMLVRPAVYAVTELPPVALPLGFTGEAYGQAGYVGGKYASAFVDGQARAERPLAALGAAKFSLGGGAWGGAQKGAARLDVGPSAALRLKLGDSASRVSMDWRFRIAGDAEPASGPALTISAGF